MILQSEVDIGSNASRCYARFTLTAISKRLAAIVSSVAQCKQPVHVLAYTIGIVVR